MSGEGHRGPSTNYMAHKRMFSKDITTSDAFREMPTSSQALYFHLGMEADDDGFLDNYKGLMRAVNATEDDLRILIAKRFLILFPSKVVVVKHWLINNTIRKDRYNETKHLEEKRALIVKENGAYTDDLSGLPSGNQMEPQYRIEEDRKVSETEDGLREQGEEETVKTYEKDSEDAGPAKAGNKFTKKYNELCDWMENLTGTRFVDRRGQFKALKLAREGEISMERLKERAEDLWHSGKYEKDGMDWFNVVYSFNKKA